MSTKEFMNIEEWLKEVKILDDLINSKILERKRLEAFAIDTTAKAPDGMPISYTGTVSRKVENATVEIIMLDREIDELTDTFVDHKQNVMAAIKKLPRKEYDVLHARYICYMTWERVAEDVNFSVQHARRVKDRALAELSRILSNDVG